MAGIYGHKWVSSYGEEVSETWVRGCADLNGEELAKGLHGCLARSVATKRSGDEDWPPTLGEFRLLARPTPYPYRNNVPALPAPKLSTEELKAIEDDIAQLRKQLRADRIQQERQWRENREARFQRARERVPGEDDEKPQEVSSEQAA